MRIILFFAVLLSLGCAGASTNTVQLKPPGLQTQPDQWYVRQVIRVKFDEQWNPIGREHFIERIRIRPIKQSDDAGRSDSLR